MGVARIARDKRQTGLRRQVQNQNPLKIPVKSVWKTKTGKQDRTTGLQGRDTLLAISKRVYGTDQMVGKICAANGINDGDKILAGQKILLP